MQQRLQNRPDYHRFRLGTLAFVRWCRPYAPRRLRIDLASMLLALALAGASILVPGGQVAAQAVPVSYPGSLTLASPSFASPNASNDPCSPGSSVDLQIFFYHQQPFTVSSPGTYTLTNLENTFLD